MATAYELRPGSSLDADYKGGRQLTRRFLVDTAPINIPTDGSLPGLPAVNSAHPTVPNARGDRLITSEVPGKKDWSYVDLLYSTNRSFGQPKPVLDTSQFGYKSWGIDYQTVVTEIVVAKKVTLSVPSPSGGAPTTQTTWAFGPDVVVKILETIPVFTRRVVLTSMSPTIWAAIYDQNNKLHQLPDGNIYRFEAGSIQETREGAWETVYSWYGDKGTHAPLLYTNFPIQDNNIIYPPGVGPGALTRPPHCQWAVIHNPAPVPTGYPAFVLQQPYEEDLGGWVTLPGDPIP